MWDIGPGLYFHNYGCKGNANAHCSDKVCTPRQLFHLHRPEIRLLSQPYLPPLFASRHNARVFGATFQPLDKSEGVCKMHQVGHTGPDDTGRGNCSAWPPGDETCSVTFRLLAVLHSQKRTAAEAQLKVQYCTHVGSYNSACGFCNSYGAAFVTEVLLLEQAIREPLNPSEILKLTLRKNFRSNPVL